MSVVFARDNVRLHSNALVYPLKENLVEGLRECVDNGQIHMALAHLVMIVEQLEEMLTEQPKTRQIVLSADAEVESPESSLAKSRKVRKSVDETDG